MFLSGTELGSFLNKNEINLFSSVENVMLCGQYSIEGVGGLERDRLFTSWCCIKMPVLAYPPRPYTGFQKSLFPSNNYSCLPFLLSQSVFKKQTRDEQYHTSYDSGRNEKYLSSFHYAHLFEKKEKYCIRII